MPYGSPRQSRTTTGGALHLRGANIPSGDRETGFTLDRIRPGGWGNIGRRVAVQENRASKEDFPDTNTSLILTGYRMDSKCLNGTRRSTQGAGVNLGFQETGFTDG